MLSRSIESFRAEHTDLSAHWRSLDSKAQGTVSIAGIFLAAAFAFVEQVSSSANSVFTNVLVFAAVVFLFISVVFALISLWVRTVLAPPLGSQYHKLVIDMLAIDLSEREERMENFLRDEIKMWRNSIEHLQKVIESKARWVIASQTMLLIAIVLVCLLTLSSVVASIPQGGQ